MIKTNTSNKKLHLADLALIAMFAAVIAVCAWIAVPSAVPFTMQTFGVFLAVGTLGGKRGTLSVLVYLLLGIIGAPVFAGFKGGAGALMGSTGGYIVGFLLSALVMWGFELAFGKKLWALAASMLLGLAVCYAFGTAWFITVYSHGNEAIGIITALSLCVFPYIIPDILKIGLALLLSKRLSKVSRLN